jgi:hypothetical protein
MSLIEEFRMYIASYPRAHDCVSTWSCIHVHVTMDTCAEFAYALRATPQNIVCTLGQSTESGYVLWARTQIS